MRNTFENAVVLEPRPVGALSGQFVIPSYQRGYRWGSSETRALLEDVFQNGNRPYCLQPVVVRKIGQEQYEVIDGQQRLTTLLLCYNYMHTERPRIHANFTIDYATRPHSREFLKGFPSNREDSDKNIEYHHISQAYQTIEEYFSQFPDNVLDEKISKLNEYFNNTVNILWYEVPDTEDANALFQRLNIGKIPLTGSELVKALFLRDSAQAPDVPQEEIALQWDQIEAELADDSLWGFLTNDPARKYPTHIDLVLDLMAGKPQNEREKYYNFFHFNRRVTQGEHLTDIWTQIVRTFLTLKEWYADNQFYHRIGYLITIGAMTLPQVYDLSQGLKKTDFLAELDKKIIQSLPAEPLESLRYGKDSQGISHVLLLMNALAIMSRNSRDKFPFHLHKGTHWSLEHIHAQQSQTLTTNKARLEWLKEHASVLKEMSPSSPLISQAEELQATIHAVMEKKSKENVGDRFQPLQQQIADALSQGDATDDIHSLANMALLKADDNSALNNSVFAVKRRHVIEWDKAGRYIPFCTRMAFSKYYTLSPGNLDYWGDADRQGYFQAIQDILSPYLPIPPNDDDDDDEHGHAQ